MCFLPGYGKNQQLLQMLTRRSCTLRLLLFAREAQTYLELLYKFVSCRNSIMLLFLVRWSFLADVSVTCTVLVLSPNIYSF